MAVELDVPQHVLRFWESRFAQIKPVKRGGGRRYYRPEDVDLLRGIRSLLYSDGFTIKGVQKLMREQGVRYVAELGRADCSLIGRLSEQPRREADDAPRHARAAIAVVEAAHPHAARAAAGHAVLEEPARVKLELLLAELLQLKSRLSVAKALPQAHAAE